MSLKLESLKLPARRIVGILERHFDPATIYLIGWSNPTTPGYSIFRRNVPPTGYYFFHFFVVADPISAADGYKMRLEIEKAKPPHVNYSLTRYNFTEFRKAQTKGSLFAHLLALKHAPILLKTSKKSDLIAQKKDGASLRSEFRAKAVTMIENSEDFLFASTVWAERKEYELAISEMHKAVHTALSAIIYQFTGVQTGAGQQLTFLIEFANYNLGFCSHQFKMADLEFIETANAELLHFQLTVVNDIDFYSVLGTATFVIAEAKTMHQQIEL